MIEDLSNNPTFLASSNLITFCLAPEEIIEVPWDIEYVLDGIPIRALLGDPMPFGWGASSVSRYLEVTRVTINNTITSIGDYAFPNWYQVTELTLSNTITHIGVHAFSDWQNVIGVTLPDGLITIANDAFYSWTSAAELVIPASVISIGSYSFSYWTSCASITCLATTPPTLGSNAFSNTNNAPIYVPAQSVAAYKSAAGWSNYASRILAIP